MKIILLDIETSPNLGYVWAKYQQDVIEYVDEWELLCWTVKELGGKSITRALCDVKNEKQLVKELWGQFNGADVIIAHNGDEFDIKKSNTKFTFYRLPPPSFYKTIDTLKVARSKFAFNSNKLNDLANYLGLGEKAETGGFKLWKGCMEGDKKSWAKMKEYNAKDVLLLEKVYLNFRPWITNHPNISALIGKPACPTCGSTHIQKRGPATTGGGIEYQTYGCYDCRARFRDTTGVRISTLKTF